MTLCLSFGRYRWFPDFSAYWKHPGIFSKMDAWPYPQMCQHGVHVGHQDFQKLSTSDPNVQSNLETTGLHTYLVRAKVNWEQQGIYNLVRALKKQWKLRVCVYTEGDSHGKEILASLLKEKNVLKEESWVSFWKNQVHGV